jgi:fatty acid desaturase
MAFLVQSIREFAPDRGTMKAEMSGTDTAQLNDFTSWKQRRIELPTAALLVVFYASWLALALGHRSVPPVVSVVGFTVLGGWFLSLQHELLHGHPTPSTAINTALGFPPLSLWTPYLRYKSAHVKHHHSDLTDPLGDPESFYIAPETWLRAGTVRRMYILSGRTLLGRLVLGTARGMVFYVVGEARLAVRDRRIRNEWLTHLAASVALGWWLFAVIDVPVWEYLLGFLYGGYAVTQLRSFAEHCAVPAGTRSAVVKAGPAMSLLYLNNNLHHTHHAQPDLPWYLIPKLHVALGSDAIAEAGAGLYRGGYVELFRRHLFSPFCQPDHPLSPGSRPIGARGLR